MVVVRFVGALEVLMSVGWMVWERVLERGS